MRLFFLYSLFLLLFAGCANIPKKVTDSSFRDLYEEDYGYCALEVVLQSQNASCGAAALTSVVRYWKVESSETEIILKLPLDPEEKGVSAKDLKGVATSFGLESYAFSMDSVEDLKEKLRRGIPVIIPTSFPASLYSLEGFPVDGLYRKIIWKFGTRKDHYVVVFGFSEDEFLIMDPAHGYTSISSKDLDEAWEKKERIALVSFPRLLVSGN